MKNSVLMVKCSCCGFQLEKDQAIKSDPWGDGQESIFCSLECVEYTQEQIDDYFSSCEPEQF